MNSACIWAYSPRVASGGCWPGWALMLFVAWAYFRFDIDRGLAGAALIGAQAAVVALIVRAVHRIGEHVLIDRGLWTIGIVAGAATLLGAPFWIILLTGAAIYTLARGGRRGLAAILLALGSVAIVAWTFIQGAAAIQPPPVLALPPGEAAWPLLFVSGLKAGLLTFGGAYTAIPFLRQDVVGRGWMGDGTFLDGWPCRMCRPRP